MNDHERRRRRQRRGVIIGAITLAFLVAITIWLCGPPEAPTHQVLA